jgi:hypothetical protein
MSMLTERLQVLISPQQKCRLEAVAQTRGESVGEIVRAAIDTLYGDTSRAERLAAVERMRSAPVATRFFTPEELTRIHEEEIEEEYPKLFPPSGPS